MEAFGTLTSVQRTILLGVLAVCLTALAIAFMVTNGRDGDSGRRDADFYCPPRLDQCN